MLKAARQNGDALGAASQLGAYGRRGAGLLVQGNHHGRQTPGASALSCSISVRMTDLATNNG